VLCDVRYRFVQMITRPEESYRLWCVVVCDLENLVNEEVLAHWGGGAVAPKTNKQTKWISWLKVTLIPFPLKYVMEPAIDPTSLAILPFILSSNLNLWHFKPPQPRVAKFLTVANNTMAAARICGVEWRQYSLRQGLKLRKPGQKCSKTCTLTQAYS
jgi:hypothetical protein